jgi:hypothetical protein
MTTPPHATMTLRLPAEVAADLAVIAECDGETVTDAIRAAVVAWVSARRRDPNVRDALRRRIDHAKQLLEVSDVDLV